VEYFEYESTDTDELDVEQFLTESHERQEKRLQEELARIEEQLSEREEIFETHQSELESKLEWYIERLENAYRQRRDPEDLKQRIEEFYRLLRQERVKHWRDRQELEQERRELLRELDEIADADLSDLL
jgi:trichohyalin